MNRDGGGDSTATFSLYQPLKCPGLRKPTYLQQPPPVNQLSINILISFSVTDIRIVRRRKMLSRNLFRETFLHSKARFSPKLSFPPISSHLPSSDQMYNLGIKHGPPSFFTSRQSIKSETSSSSFRVFKAPLSS